MKPEKEYLKNVKVVDLFAGIGGFHLAFSSFGADIVYASEWDKHAADVYERNFNIKPQGDITKIDENSIPEHDILCAGFPCQAFSISGKQLGFDDSRGTLFFDVARIVKAKKPKIIFMENVKNFANHDNGNTLRVVKKTIEKLGYDFYFDVLNAADFGVPQSRHRIYMLAFRKDLNIREFEFPQKTKLTKCVKDILQPYEETKEFIINRTDIVMNGKKEMLSDKPVRIGTVNKGGQGERIYSTLGTAITLSAYGGGVGSKTGLYYVDGHIRKLSPRECARLTGFPDEFIISENKNTSYKQFGNSVVVDVLQTIIEKMINTKGAMSWA